MTPRSTTGRARTIKTAAHARDAEPVLPPPQQTRDLGDPQDLQQLEQLRETEGRKTRDKRRETRDERRETRDERRTTRDERRTTRDERQTTKKTTTKRAAVAPSREEEEERKKKRRGRGSGAAALSGLRAWVHGSSDLQPSHGGLQAGPPRDANPRWLTNGGRAVTPSSCAARTPRAGVARWRAVYRWSGLSVSLAVVLLPHHHYAARSPRALLRPRPRARARHHTP